MPEPTPTTPLPALRVYDTLGRRISEFAPTAPGRATIYSCGPTVYRDAHIGNLRSYLMADWLRRFLEAQGYAVTHIKNITDVGHMREDVLDRGEDKVIAAARAAGMTPQAIADHYTERFLHDEQRLGILPATRFPRATECVDEMIAIIERLVGSGHAYEVNGNVYFAVATFPGYGKLSRQQADGLEESGRAAPDPLKRDQRDFALWKAAEPRRTLKWFSPWGYGFPGWHIECSAIGHEFLGDVIDFHTGGVDNIFPHHEDEIAQSEAAFGHRHVRTWVHGQHLLVDGLKMAKSTGNVYLLSDLEDRGFDPLAFRYLCATAKYRTRLNFTLASLRAAQRGLERLRAAMCEDAGEPSDETEARAGELRREFWTAAANDLDIPAALAVAWKVARSGLPTATRRELLIDFDRLLGLDLARPPVRNKLPADAIDLLRQCHVLRQEQRYPEADAVRAEIIGQGYEVRQTPASTVALPVPAWRREEPGISSSRDVDSLLQQNPQVEYTVSIVARSGCRELERCVASAETWLQGASAEVIVVDNGFEEECQAFIDDVSAGDERLRLFRADHFLGSAAARNVTLRQARGRFVVFIDTSVEVKGDIFTPLRKMLEDPTVGVAGCWGVQTNDLREFTEAKTSGDVHAVEGYLMAFRRSVLREVGLLDEKFRFYRHLDLDFSFAVRSRGYRAVIDTTLPVVRHEHVDWMATPPEERDRLSKRNFYRFLRKWEKHPELLSAGR
ncbi:MAG TPA: cysteine--tRNA ligase [Dehalococcoidia bacterium]|nr:cysteine--tRNA ligase [Dehalococcoidia bacterium]